MVKVIAGCLAKSKSKINSKQCIAV